MELAEHLVQTGHHQLVELLEVVGMVVLELAERVLHLVHLEVVLLEEHLGVLLMMEHVEHLEVLE